MHSGSKQLKTAKNKFTWCDFTICVLSKFQQIRITSVPSYCRDFIFKICQTVAGISITSQFHEFFWISFLAGFCYLAQLWAPAWTATAIHPSLASRATTMYYYRDPTSPNSLLSNTKSIAPHKRHLGDFLIKIRNPNNAKRSDLIYTLTFLFMLLSFREINNRKVSTNIK